MESALISALKSLILSLDMILILHLSLANIAQAYFFKHIPQQIMVSVYVLIIIIQSLILHPYNVSLALILYVCNVNLQVVHKSVRLVLTMLI